ncbi:DUF1540 domain-containing protein [Senegalia massiliensis]|uniref:DUF1540 domain-containing protein n=1 Tax=Senegalia massiliensis TaxID=1720316 RepID=A0A845QRB1_9CLOT|nr:DUF1540 domain-containing protein [Senegalia massiliensis]NBI05317.1 DUF1540 domain-containing protein [Senegalia massiliensis]
MSVEKTNSHLPGVKCSVNTCYYHAEGNYCNAEKIQIKPMNAQSVQETDCGTFEKK